MSLEGVGEYGEVGEEPVAELVGVFGDYDHGVIRPWGVGILLLLWRCR